MSTIKNCIRCGHMFTQMTVEKYCEECSKENEKSFKIVREYIYSNPNRSISEVAHATGVDEKLILEFIRLRKITNTTK